MRAIAISVLLLTLPLAGCLGGEESPTSYTVTLTEAPETVDADDPFTVSWTVAGPDGEIPHTGTHWADRSIADPQSPGDYGNTSGAEEPTTVPGDHSTEITLSEAGTYYLRAHATDGTTHYWSDEVTITVEGSVVPPIMDDGNATVDVTLTSAPASVAAGTEFTIMWTLDGDAGRITHTGSHWAAHSVDDPQGPGDYGNSSGVVQPADVPGEYNATITIDEPGTYYLRAHAIRENQHYWSDEATIQVTGDAGSPTVHAVEATDLPLAFAPDNISIAVGDAINWTNTGSLAHTVTFERLNGTDDNQIADLAAGQSIQYTFTEPGTYRYRCTYHSATYDGAGMTGVVIVEGAEDGADGASE